MLKGFKQIEFFGKLENVKLNIGNNNNNYIYIL